MYTADRTEEQILVMRAQRGEQDAFRVLAERYQKLIFTLALRMTGSRENAEDVCQEALLSAWQGLPGFRMDAAFSTWLYKLTMNAATDLLRRQKKEQDNVSLDGTEGVTPAAGAASDPQARAEGAERRALLQEAVSSLTENHRQILLLREVTGLGYQEIGQMLELTPGTVKSRLARARMELRNKLLEGGNYFTPASSKIQEGGAGSEQL